MPVSAKRVRALNGVPLCTYHEHQLPFIRYNFATGVYVQSHPADASDDTVDLLHSDGPVDTVEQAADLVREVFDPQAPEALDRLLRSWPGHVQDRALHAAFVLERPASRTAKSEQAAAYFDNALELLRQGVSAATVLHYYNYGTAGSVSAEDHREDLIRDLLDDGSPDEGCWEVELVGVYSVNADTSDSSYSDAAGRDDLWQGTEHKSLCMALGCVPSQLDAALANEDQRTWVQPNPYVAREFTLHRIADTVDGSTLIAEERVDAGAKEETTHFYRAVFADTDFDL